MAINFLNTVAVDENVLFVDTVNDRVGIGTATPSYTLQVGDGTEDSTLSTFFSDGSRVQIHGYGLYMSRVASYIRPVTTTTQTLYVGSSSNIWNVISNNANTHCFSTGANEWMRITSTGRVGIGTTSPATKLHINDGANVNLKVGGIGGELQIKTTNDADTAYTPMVLRASEYNLMNGNVGIGTTTPSTLLQVDAGLGSGYNGVFVADEFAGTSRITSSKNPMLSLGTSTDSGATAAIFMGASATPEQFSKIEYNRSTNSLGIHCKGQGTYKEHLRFGDISSATPRSVFFGNVGIGTTNPSSSLDIKSAMGTAGNFNSIQLRLDSSDTVDTTGFQGMRFATSTAPNYGWTMGANRSTSGRGSFRFYEHNNSIPGTERFTLLQGGNVGIGATNPTSRLTVQENGITTKIATVTIGDTTAGASLTLRGGSPTIYFDRTGTDPENKILMDSAGLEFKTGTLDAEGDVDFKITADGDLQLSKGAKISNQENTDIDSAAAEVVAQVAHATYTAAFFDFVVKKGTNVRSGTVYACHDGDTAPLVEFTETSTNDLGDTSDVTLSVDISGANMRLLATVTSDDWSVKSLIRAI